MSGVSRALAYLLRHDADAPREPGGWVEVEWVLEALRERGFRLDASGLAALAAGDSKGRYALEGHRIRAVQGHSAAVELELESAVPPATLYHGTTHRFVAAIRAEGLRRMGRHHVHLSADADTARAVGARRGAPVVLVVDSGAMAADGVRFWRATNGVWLVDAVAPRFLRCP